MSFLLFAECHHESSYAASHHTVRDVAPCFLSGQGWKAQPPGKKQQFLREARCTWVASQWVALHVLIRFPVAFSYSWFFFPTCQSGSLKQRCGSSFSFLFLSSSAYSSYSYFPLLLLVCPSASSSRLWASTGPSHIANFGCSGPRVDLNPIASSGCSGPRLDPNTRQRECQTECGAECQAECPNICQIECQKD